MAGIHRVLYYRTRRKRRIPIAFSLHLIFDFVVRFECLEVEIQTGTETRLEVAAGVLALP